MLTWLHLRQNRNNECASGGIRYLGTCSLAPAPIKHRVWRTSYINELCTAQVADSKQWSQIIELMTTVVTM